MSYCVDFETTKIVSGSNVTPTPVGVAIKLDDTKPDYISWGHPRGNNSTEQQAYETLLNIVKSNDDVVMHNSKFDYRIMLEYFQLPPVSPHKLHDTLIMAYLHDPRDESFRLKDLAYKYCDIPPDEQAKLRDWILKHVPTASQKTWGEYICMAPADIVGHYACDDVNMTYALYNYFKPIIYEARED